MNDSPAIDTEQIAVLTQIFTDILDQKIPAFRDRHGVGVAVEENIIVMLQAALDCVERCAALAFSDPALSAAYERRVQLTRDLIANVQAQRDEWLEVELWLVVAEGENETKH